VGRGGGVNYSKMNKWKIERENEEFEEFERD
jgi:hypothetical protein